MENKCNGDSTTSNCHMDDTESTLEVGVKTLDQRTYKFLVQKDIPVSALKEKIAKEAGIPVDEQRLIFGGKVLNDEHLLTEYHIENGNTLHMVRRQPRTQDQQSTDSRSDPTGTGSVNQSNDGPGSRNRGPVAHSVVLGTFNANDQPEGVIPDLNQVIGAVLNSMGLSGATAATAVGGIQFSVPPNTNVQAAQGNGASGVQIDGNINSQSETRPSTNLAAHGPQSSHTPQFVQTPMAAITSPSTFPAPIPDSLSTLSEFITRMEQSIQQTANDQGETSSSGTNMSVELPVNTHGQPTPEALGVVLQRAEQLLSARAAPILLHITGRLGQHALSTDTVTRAQVQAEAIQTGIAMQHLGALCLELGRTMLTLRLGRSPGESFLNSGPAVYISPLGPNPIMVQPSSQTPPLFDGTFPSLNAVNFSPPGAGAAPRNINIHIHTGISLVPLAPTGAMRLQAGEGVQPGMGGRSDTTATQAPQETSTIDVSTPQSVQDVPTAVIQSAHASQPPVHHDLQVHDEATGPTNQSCESKNASSGCLGPSDNSLEGCKSSTPGGTSQQPSESTATNDPIHDSKAVPLGLGHGILDRKANIKKSKSAVAERTGVTSSDNAKISVSDYRSDAPRVLGSNKTGIDEPASGQADTVRAAPTGSNTQPAATGSLSQVFNIPALSGLIGGNLNQSGAASSSLLGNMIQQLGQNPQIMNTVNQIAQQVNTHDVDMFSSSGMSQIMEQMMPVVSQFLGQGAPSAPPFSSSEGVNHTNANGTGSAPHGDEQMDMEQVAMNIENADAPTDVFRAVAESAAGVVGEGNVNELVHSLSNNEELAREYVQMLCRDVGGRTQEMSDQDKKQ